MSDTTEFDNKYALYELDEDDDGYEPGLIEKITATIDEFIATLTDEEVASASGWDDPFNLSDRAVAFAKERGLGPNLLGFTDTASREEFFAEIEKRNTTAPLTAAEVAETLINGNISTAREAIVLNRTPTEAVVFALDVVAALAISMSADPNPMDALLAHERALDKIRRCVNRG